MSYIDGTIDAPYDTAESQGEIASYRQAALDLFYRIGCQYNIKSQDMRDLCALACINFEDLQKHSGLPVTY